MRSGIVPSPVKRESTVTRMVRTTGSAICAPPGCSTWAATRSTPCMCSQMGEHVGPVAGQPWPPRLQSAPDRRRPRAPFGRPNEPSHLTDPAADPASATHPRVVPHLQFQGARAVGVCRLWRDGRSRRPGAGARAGPATLPRSSEDAAVLAGRRAHQLRSARRTRDRVRRGPPLRTAVGNSASSASRSVRPTTAGGPASRQAGAGSRRSRASGHEAPVPGAASGVLSTESFHHLVGVYVDRTVQVVALGGGANGLALG